MLRRAICGYQTRGYWQTFANLAYRIRDDSTLADLKIELARLRENYRFPSDEEFERELTERDLYGLRVCRHLLDSLENHATKEPTDTSGYSIEHIMPQNERLPVPWRSMLGENWREVHKSWLNRLGNLTLTGYNSEYQDHSFDEKKTIKGGFLGKRGSLKQVCSGAVRLDRRRNGNADSRTGAAVAQDLAPFGRNPAANRFCVLSRNARTC